MARPYSDNPANDQIRVRCTNEDKEEVRKRATAAGVSMSEYLLRCGLPDKEPSAGRRTIIHVNMHVIRANLKTGARDPVLTVKAGRSNTYAHTVDIAGPSRVVYSPDKPLKCGARVWIETTARVDPG